MQVTNPLWLTPAFVLLFPASSDQNMCLFFEPSSMVTSLPPHRFECTRRRHREYVAHGVPNRDAEHLHLNHALITESKRARTGYAVMDFVTTSWKRMRSGDRPGLQNRRVAGNPVTGGFDPHSLPPVLNSLQATEPAEISLRSQNAICTTLACASDNCA